MSEQIPTRARLVSAAGHWLFAWSLVLYVATAGGSLTTSDASMTFDVARNLVESGTPALSGQPGDPVEYAPFGLMQSLYDVPFYLLGKAAVHFGHLNLGKPDSVPKAAVAMGQTLVSAALVWLIFRLSLLLGAAPVPSLMAAVTLAAGSLIWPYSKFGFNQPLAAVALMSALVGMITGVRHNRPSLIVLAGLAAGAGLLTRHELALTFIPMAAWLLLAEAPTRHVRLGRLLLFLPGACLGIAGWLLYNFIRFADPLNSGQVGDPRHGFMSPVIPGLLGLLWSPATAVWIYSPVAAVGFAGLIGGVRKDRALVGTLLVLTVGLTVFYASLGNWLGGRSYGSRYLYVTLPLLGAGWALFLSACRPAPRRAWFLAVTFVGMVIQMPGVLVDYAKVSQELARRHGAVSTSSRQWEWSASPISMNTQQLVTALPDNLSFVFGRRTPPRVSTTGGAGDRSFSQQFGFSLDFWWLYLFYLGAVGRAGLFAIVIVLAGSLWVCSAQLHRAARALARLDASSPS
jgi:hypothetical protein